ncbi:hypothetical protein GSI_11550 [Ganoderma sinense ZZ0214-1]|uniref:Uncharacterized protein n=1 Tax=Ganoderma sinense ZZ0214-1 TaxID=1077348 RepID=A0A2G8RWA7_9APHY|nr:hypothetical protein GSI_11550 [Ganoderma sinense ZZ0214-1]
MTDGASEILRGSCWEITDGHPGHRCSTVLKALRAFTRRWGTAEKRPWESEVGSEGTAWTTPSGNTPPTESSWSALSRGVCWGRRNRSTASSSYRNPSSNVSHRIFGARSSVKLETECPCQSTEPWSAAAKSASAKTSPKIWRISKLRRPTRVCVCVCSCAPVLASGTPFKNWRQACVPTLVAEEPGTRKR